MKVRECFTEIRRDENGQPYEVSGERWIERPDEEIAAYQSMAEQESRFERAMRLRECDWTQAADVPMSADQRTAWATYRQALRDVTKQAGFPDAIVWPEAP